MVKDSLFLYKNINIKEAGYFNPTWHPTEAGYYFRLINDMGSNNICYYDTTEEYVNLPKKFEYYPFMETGYNHYNPYGTFYLSKVVTNSKSSDPVFNTTPLNDTEGSFTIAKLLPESKNDPPSIDLYCRGKVQMVKGHWDVDNHSHIEYYINNFNVTYDASESNYDLNKTIRIKYECDFTFTPADEYEYSSYYIRFTINWGKNSSGKLIYVESQNSSGYITIPIPSSFVENVTPTITVSGKLYSKLKSGGDDPVDPPDDPESWKAYAVGDHATYDETTNKYVSLFSGTEVKVDGIFGDNRHCSWNIWDNWYGVYEWIGVSAWIPSSWINPPNKPKP